MPIRKSIMLTALTLSLMLAQTGAVVPQKGPALQKKPLRLEQLRQQLSPAPSALRSHGTAFYDFTINLPAQIVVNLYNESKLLLATVELTEEVFQQRFLFKIKSPDGSESWVRRDTIAQGSQILFSLDSSAGRTLHVRLETVANERPRKVSKLINSASVSNGVQTTQYQLPGVTGNPQSEQFRKLATALSQAEDENIFTTAQLRTLQAVLRNLETLLAPALPGHRNEQSATAEEEDGCSVHCYRQISLLPVFVCDGGYYHNCDCSGDGDGGFFIPGCMLSILCHVDCCEFRQCTDETLKGAQQPKAGRKLGR